VAAREPKRLLVEPSAIERGLLRGADFHHVRNVLRLDVGAELELADGRGNLHRCRLARRERGRFELEVTGSAQLPAPPPPLVTVIHGAARGGRSELVLQKCTELGADALVLALCERSTVRGELRPAKGARHREIVRQAARQSGRLFLPRLAQRVPLAEALPATVDRDAIDVRVIAAIGGDPLAAVEDRIRATRPARVTLAVGPEGGFTAGELALAAERGFRPTSLGPLTLRSETAAVVLTALAMHFSDRLTAPHEAL